MANLPWVILEYSKANSRHNITLPVKISECILKKEGPYLLKIEVKLTYSKVHKS